MKSINQSNFSVKPLFTNSQFLDVLYNRAHLQKTIFWKELMSNMGGDVYYCFKQLPKWCPVHINIRLYKYSTASQLIHPSIIYTTCTLRVVGGARAKPCWLLGYIPDTSPAHHRANTQRQTTIHTRIHTYGQALTVSRSTFTTFWDVELVGIRSPSSVYVSASCCNSLSVLLVHICLSRAITAPVITPDQTG